MAAGDDGPAVQWAIQSQIAVGRALGATRLIPVSCAHLMGDMEVLGESGYEFMAWLASHRPRVRVPTTTNARCVDFEAANRLRQSAEMVLYEARLKKLLSEIGITLTDTCINYQTVYQPTLREHLAWGDTGAVIYANSIFGARSNFESGPAALSAGLTGRTPEYGFHRDVCRRGTVRVELTATPRDLADWGALGAAVGRRVNDYWAVPVFEGAPENASPDAVKHLGAALASYGSLAMFHLVGQTPEAPDEETAFGGRQPDRTIVVDDAAVRTVYDSYSASRERADLVLFTGPQLSILELRVLTEAFAGKKVHGKTTVIVTTNIQNHGLAAELGYLDLLREAGVLVLVGTCFYLMNVPEMRNEFGWRTAVTNSAKVANILGGYEMHPILRRTPACIEAAITGQIPNA